jgi:hypothetical protein
MSYHENKESIKFMRGSLFLEQQKHAWPIIYFVKSK